MSGYSVYLKSSMTQKTTKSTKPKNSYEDQFDDISQQIDTLELATQLAAELGPDLTECTPKHGVERFLTRKQQDVTQGTLDEYADKLSRLPAFCDQHGIDDLRELDGRVLDDYIFWLRNESSDEVDELAPKTMRDELYLLRECVAYFESIEAVKPGLSDAITIPELETDDGVRDVELEAERVADILDYLNKYEYGTLEHVTLLLLARTGRRTGCIHSLDQNDVHIDEENPYIELRHRPDEGTRLKNDEKSEGHIAITQEVAQVLADYISTNRPDVTDDYGRAPLLATKYGRASKSTIRRIVYTVTRPCEIGKECPHDRDPSDCDAAQRRNAAVQCPSSHSPHDLKHGYISNGRRKGVPLDVLSDRCDVTEECLRKHYDESTQEERCEIRRRILDEHAGGDGGGYL